MDLCPFFRHNRHVFEKFSENHKSGFGTDQTPQFPHIESFFLHFIRIGFFNKNHIGYSYMFTENKHNGVWAATSNHGRYFPRHSDWSVVHKLYLNIPYRQYLNRFQFLTVNNNNINYSIGQQRKPVGNCPAQMISYLVARFCDNTAPLDIKWYYYKIVSRMIVYALRNLYSSTQHLITVLVDRERNKKKSIINICCKIQIIFNRTIVSEYKLNYDKIEFIT